MNRYIAEHRGEDFPEEWCVVDEFARPIGRAVIFDLNESFAKTIADALNEDEYVRWDGNS